MAARPARPRVLRYLRQAGGDRDRRAAPRDAASHDGLAVARVLLRHRAGRRGRAPRQQVAGYADLDVRPHLLCHALVLVRADGDRRVLDLPAMAAGGRLRGCDAQHVGPRPHPRHRAPSRAADHDAGPHLPRDLPAHHARLHARSADTRFRAHGARQGARRDDRRLAPRAAQCALADGYADRPAGGDNARRFGRGRKRVLAAGPGAPRLRKRRAARPQYAARHRVRLGRARHHRQLRRRPRLREARSAHQDGELMC